MSETLFGTTTPSTIDSGDGAPYEMGTVFTAAITGNVTGVRFYKSTNNTGTHVGHLWTIGGTLLATITFSGESLSGWQEMDFSAPVSIAANTQYVISVSVPNGHYSDNANFFTTNNYSNGQNLVGVKSSLAPHGNGVFNTTPGQFPTTFFNDTNYWVDLVFSTVSGVVPGVTNIPMLNAQQSLVSAGYYAYPISTAYSTTVSVGSVISQSPVGGTALATGSSVALVESLGPAPTPIYETVLMALQTAAVGILAADTFFNGLASANSVAVPIITEKKGDIHSQILACLGSVGICALVMTPIFEFHAHEAQDLSGWAFLTVTIYEDVPVNQSSQGTGIFGIALAERTVAVLHWAPHGIYTAAISPETTAASRFLGIPRPIEFVSDGPPLQYNVSFQAHVTLSPQYL